MSTNDDRQAGDVLESAIAEALLSKHFENFDRTYNLSTTIAAALRALNLVRVEASE